MHCRQRIVPWRLQQPCASQRQSVVRTVKGERNVSIEQVARRRFTSLWRLMVLGQLCNSTGPGSLKESVPVFDPESIPFNNQPLYAAPSRKVRWWVPIKVFPDKNCLSGRAFRLFGQGGIVGMFANVGKIGPQYDSGAFVAACETRAESSLAAGTEGFEPLGCPGTFSRAARSLQRNFAGQGWFYQSGTPSRGRSGD